VLAVPVEPGLPPGEVAAGKAGWSVRGM